MNDFIQFLTSKEIMAVYVISGVVCFICLVVYIYQKTSERIRRKNNTRELNKLIEEVRERVPVEEETISYEEPVLEEIEVLDDGVSVSDMLSTIKEEEEVLEVEDPVIETPEVEEFEYTSIEPDIETARKELERLTKELEAQEKLEKENVVPVSKFEEEQEANAIISVDELLKRGKELYEVNEEMYQDTGDEPISIQEVEQLMKKEEKVVPEVIEKKEEKKVEKQPIKEEIKRFKSTPFISPIYGIEKKHELELENTANYDKLDEQIKKSNEFVMSLKEFQNNLD